MQSYTFTISIDTVALMKRTRLLLGLSSLFSDSPGLLSHNEAKGVHKSRYVRAIPHRAVDKSHYLIRICTVLGRSLSAYSVER